MNGAHPASAPENSIPMAELRASCARLPLAPGVYAFLAGDGSPLYVGKSVRLRERVASYFQPAAQRRAKVRRLCRTAQALRIERTGSEFEALLRELELIQEWRPPFNVRMRDPERYAYIGVDYAQPFPRLAVSGEPRAGARWWGPFARPRQIARLVEVLADSFALRTCEPLPATACWRQQTRRCSAPCVGAIGAGEYGRNFLFAHQTMSGLAAAALRELRGERDRLAAAESFEAAATRQRRIEAVEGLRRVLFASARAWCDAIVVQPGAALDSVVLWAVGGAVVGDSARGDIADIDALFAQLWGAGGRPRTDGEPLAKEEVDRRRIVHQWVRSPGGAEWCVATAGRGRAEVLAEVRALAARAVRRLV
jgi:excinuclease ABC subunit C